MQARYTTIVVVVALRGTYQPVLALVDAIVGVKCSGEVLTGVVLVLTLPYV